LSLWLCGDVNNVPEQMYVKLNGVKVLYDGDAGNLTKPFWRPWNINLTDFAGVNLSNVTELSIGLERSGFTGGTGMVLFDDIRLYPFERQFITPAEPGTANLAGHWMFDEGSGTIASDSSGYGNDGTLGGNATWGEGLYGGSVYVNGASDTGWVEINPASWAPIEKEVTVAFWAFGDEAMPNDGFAFGAYSADTNAARQASGHIPWSSMTVFWDSGYDGSNYDRIQKGLTDESIYKGTWTHWAFTKDCDTGDAKIFINGELWHSATGMTRPMTGVIQFTIGARGTTDHAQGYIGWLDDFRLYDRALSQGEIAWLGGVTVPFDKPF